MLVIQSGESVVLHFPVVYTYPNERNCEDRWEYMFLPAGNIMPGTEKFWGELLFLEEKWLLFSTAGRKNSFSKRNKCSSQRFFGPGIMFFSLKDTFSWGFILWPTKNHYYLIGSVSYCPYRFCIIVVNQVWGEGGDDS